ncbi:pentapeptide repeat-containing protein [Ruegeria arenilitoris]|uniref:pentapeptide repeat-containing protein n=1 Tax=Ruegeria arenilitoris TaxID=1173585 RepID=UPI00147D61E4|nr:pentapeptide repeat-containing protein [Ruegeria arenilitoris]
MEFQKPERIQDINKAVLNSALVLAKIQFQDAVSAAEPLKDIWKALKGELSDHPVNRAWTLISTSATTALVSLLRQPRLRSPLTDEECTEVARTLLEEIPEKGVILGSHLINLGMFPPLQGCVEQVPNIIRRASPEVPFKDDELRLMFQESLATALSKIATRQSDIYSELIVTLCSEAALPDERKFAWSRHNAWIQKLFTEDPIFSPDGDIDIPLSQVYLKLRCYWNEERSKKMEEGTEALKYRTATVSDLHSTVKSWLNAAPEDDRLRLIAGGPGSGKSSFSKALAAELVNEGRQHVVFIPLQYVDMKSDFAQTIATYLSESCRQMSYHYSEGFPSDPLTWYHEATLPYVLIFDGLDELTSNEEEGAKQTKEFVGQLSRYLSTKNGRFPMRAVVLGRDIAIEQAVEGEGIALKSILHVAPIRPIERDDLRLEGNPEDEDIEENFDPVNDPMGLMGDDQRLAYWERWSRLQGQNGDKLPEPVTHESMSELNVEPLLLHLLIISEFCGDRWKEAADNRNLVYQDILSKVFYRNQMKELRAYKKLEEIHFFELMEVFGLAAFRGNGRTGNHDDFSALRALYADEETEATVYEELNGAQLKNVALMVHAREQGNHKDKGFEFVHKSFGEYLSARALVGLARRLAEKKHSKPNKLAPIWSKLIGGGTLTSPVLRFLRDEAKLQCKSDQSATIAALTRVFEYTLQNGFPVHDAKLAPNPTFRQLEKFQKASESSMLATLSSFWWALYRPENGGPREYIEFKLLRENREAVSDLIYRLLSQPEDNHYTEVTLSGVSLQQQNLSHMRLGLSDLRGADLRNVNFTEAELAGADLRGADLRRARLTNVDLDSMYVFLDSIKGGNFSLVNADLRHAILTGTQMRGLDLTGLDMRFARLVSTKLSGADLSEANLSGAELVSVEWDRVMLTKTKMRRASLSNMAFEGIDVEELDMTEMCARKVDFSGCKNLSQEQVNSFFGVKSGPWLTRLPEGLDYPDHWYERELFSEDHARERILFSRAYRAWRDDT